ncbi:MAG TPA: CDP-alcohol phosphatidyltransferase family protein [Micromonosporaceae bacterium]|nr:CDP-alcohol phosphatidyltransferase family protein [Micromonosporaceae bacterium]
MTWEAYIAQWSTLHGGFDPDQASPFVRGWLRIAYTLGRVFARVRVTPMALTAAGLILNVAAIGAAAAGGGWPAIAALFVVLGAVADSVDGAVAVLTERTTRLGYLYDSLANRVAELCWLVAFWVLGAPTWVLVICGGLAWLHEYIRARATAVGLTEVGAMTVGESVGRISITVVGLLLAGAAGLISRGLAAGTVTIAAVVWVFLGAFGLFQLLSGVRKSLR